MTAETPLTDHPAVAEGVFTWPSAEPRLLGTRCTRCGTVTFPRRSTCPRCTATQVEDHLLSRTGTLWSFTVQAFPPKPPYLGHATFTPYGVGYVELPDPVLVEARLVGPPDRFRIGMPMELVAEPLVRDGGTVVTYAFQPAGEEP